MEVEGCGREEKGRITRLNHHQSAFWVGGAKKTSNFPPHMPNKQRDVTFVGTVCFRMTGEKQQKHEISPLCPSTTAIQLFILRPTVVIKSGVILVRFFLSYFSLCHLDTDELIFFEFFSFCTSVCIFVPIVGRGEQQNRCRGG